MTRSGGAALALLALAACKKSAPPPAPSPSASAVASVAPSVSAAPSVAPTASVAPRIARPYAPAPLAADVSAACAKLAGMKAKLPEAGTEPYVSRYVRELPGKCIASGPGAWSFRISRYSEADGQPSLLFELVHLGATGVIDAASPVPTMEEGPTKDLNCCQVYGGTAITATPLADYDGDGEVELYLAAIQTGDEGHHEERHVVYTFHDGKLSKFAPVNGLPIVGARDVDKDGLPDLELAYFEAYPTSACSGFSHYTRGPVLVAHALGDGTFSLTDAEAAKVARAACPARPADRHGNGAACARVWGESTEAVTAWLAGATSACRAKHPLPDDAGCDYDDPCADDETALAFAKAKPVIDLSKVAPP